MSSLSEKKEEFIEVLAVIENILEFDKIERFKFTPKEKTAILFVTDLLNIHIKELEKY